MKMFSIPFVSREKKYLTLQILPDRVSAQVISVDKNNRISLGAAWENFEWSRYAQKLRPNRVLPTVIVAAHPSLVYTSIIPVRLTRAVAETPVTAVEMENVLGQTLTKIFNQERELAAEALGSPALDTVLVQSDASNFKIDGHEILHPVGQKGERLDATFEITFVPRELFERWRNFFNSSSDFFFTDLSRAFLSILEKVGSLPVRFFLVEPERTTYYAQNLPSTVRRAPLLRRGDAGWRGDSLTVALVDSWGVSPAVAAALYGAYQRQEISASVAQHFESLFKEPTSAFFKAISQAKFREKAYIHSHHPLPSSYFSPERAPALEQVPIQKIIEFLGMELKDPKNIPMSALPHLVSFLEFYYDKKDSPVNYWLKRRVHWLTPS